MDPALKIHFIAHFNDGSTIEMVPFEGHLDGQSKLDPAKNTFFDVLQRINEVKSFAVFEAGSSPLRYVAVDLMDGHFEIAGQPFWIEQPPTNVKLNLIYFRRVTRDFINGQPSGINVKHFIGWEAENKKVTVFVE